MAVQTLALQLCGLAEEADFESRLQAALESARTAWRESLLHSTESAVSEALQKVEEEFVCRLEREKSVVEERVRLDCAKDKERALALLQEALVGRQAGLSVGVQSAASWEGVAGEAMRRAREQCEEDRSREKAALRAELEEQHGQDLKEAVRRALERAKAHYEGLLHRVEQGLALAVCDLSLPPLSGVVAHVRSKLAAEQRDVVGQQVAEQEALRRQLSAVEERLHQEQLWRREVGGGGGRVLCFPLGGAGWAAQR